MMLRLNDEHRSLHVVLHHNLCGKGRDVADVRMKVGSAQAHGGTKAERSRGHRQELRGGE